MYSNKIEFYFVRHGQTNWGREDILRGPQDLDLNSIGITQAKEAGMKLKKRIDRNVKMITSPLQRALQTTYYISEITNIQIYDAIQFLTRRQTKNFIDESMLYLKKFFCNTLVRLWSYLTKKFLNG